MCIVGKSVATDAEVYDSLILDGILLFRLASRACTVCKVRSSGCVTALTSRERRIEHVAHSKVLNCYASSAGRCCVPNPKVNGLRRKSYVVQVVYVCRHSAGAGKFGFPAGYYVGDEHW